MRPPPAPRPLAHPVGRAADAGLAALAHFGIAFGFLGIGFLVSLAIDAVIWAYGRRSPYVAFQARQAGCYHIFVIVFNIAYFIGLGVLAWMNLYFGWTWAGNLAVILFIAFWPWFVVSILYGLWGGLMVLLGRDFRYPYFGRTK